MNVVKVWCPRRECPSQPHGGNVIGEVMPGALYRLKCDRCRWYTEGRGGQPAMRSYKPELKRDIALRTDSVSGL